MGLDRCPMRKVWKSDGGFVDEIPMNVETRETLRALVSKAQASGHSYLFTNPATGMPYTSLKTAWNTACKRGGITNLWIHDLRHTFGTRAAEAGAPLRAIQDVMGHSSITMTERYAHATHEGKRRVVEAAGLKRERWSSKWRQKVVEVKSLDVCPRCV